MQENFIIGAFLFFNLSPKTIVITSPKIKSIALSLKAEIRFVSFSLLYSVM